MPKRTSPEHKQKLKFERRILDRYGITLEQKQKMFDKQQGCCLVCGRHATELKSPLCIDHCHYTGKVRGLLCYGCNTGLSYYEKHKEGYEKYLSKFIINI